MLSGASPSGARTFLHRQIPAAIAWPTPNTSLTLRLWIEAGTDATALSRLYDSGLLSKTGLVSQGAKIYFCCKCARWNHFAIPHI